MNKSLWTSLLLIGSLTLNTVIASVTVEVNQEQYVFTHAPRLIEVLAPFSNQKSWYWPAAALYQADDTQLEKKRQLLLRNLFLLAKSYKIEAPKIAQSLGHLQLIISNWHIARRLPIKIDYDLARMKADANPQFPSGKYILSVKPRMNTVYIFGAVDVVGDVTHQLHADASEYITSQFLTDLADRDIVILLQADGRKIIVPVAYWNKAHQEVMPGSLIFVPFKPSIFQPELAIINQQIMTLARNRVL